MKNLFMTDFDNLYEELTKLYEEDSLVEASTKEYGKYKKAFLNFLYGDVYYNQDGSIHGNESNIQKTKYIDFIKDEHDLKKIAKAYGVPLYYKDDTGKEHKYNLNTPEDRRTVVQAIHKVMDKTNGTGRLIQHKDKNGKISYTAYRIAPSVLHHIDGLHDHNVGIKQYKDSNGKITYLVDFAQTDKVSALGNYVLIEANNARNARYVHMIIHLLGMVAKVLGVENENTIEIIKAFTDNISKKQVSFTIATKPVDENTENKIVFKDTEDFLKDFLTTNACYETPTSPLARLVAHSEGDLPIASATATDPVDEEETYEVPAIESTEEQIAPEKATVDLEKEN